jgi:hypothetical protein
MWRAWPTGKAVALKQKGGNIVIHVGGKNNFVKFKVATGLNEVQNFQL